MANAFVQKRMRHATSQRTFVILSPRHSEAPNVPTRRNRVLRRRRITRVRKFDEKTDCVRRRGHDLAPLFEGCDEKTRRLKVNRRTSAFRVTASGSAAD